VATASGMSWLSGHRSSVTRWVTLTALIVVLGAGSIITLNLRSSAADLALGAALDAYNSPVAQPGAPVTPGVYATAAERAKAANEQFVAIASKYGWLSQGVKAHYFAGITYEQMGQTTQAETELKAAAGSWNRNLANLAKLALAALYEQNSRGTEAIEIYTGLISKPSETVPATSAQLQLADLYATQGKMDQARKLWAAVKDADKDGAAGAIAAQALNAKQ